VGSERDERHRGGLGRRALLKLGLFGAAGYQLGLIDRTARPTQRLAHPRPAGLPDIQFDVADFLGPVETIDGVRFRFGPVSRSS
jgi:hypothetical protein